MYFGLFLNQLKQIHKRSEHQTVLVAIRSCLKTKLKIINQISNQYSETCNKFSYKTRRTGKRMRFPASRLPVTKAGTSESFDCHFDEAFHTGKLQNVFLSSGGFENHVVGEKFRFLTTAGSTWYAVNLKIGKQLEFFCNYLVYLK